VVGEAFAGAGGAGGVRRGNSGAEEPRRRGASSGRGEGQAARSGSGGVVVAESSPAGNGGGVEAGGRFLTSSQIGRFLGLGLKNRCFSFSFDFPLIGFKLGDDLLEVAPLLPCDHAHQVSWQLVKI
jgi:hypothetical protein